MPAFDTPEPLSVTLEFDMGAARITAGKRLDTVVEVRPHDPAEEADIRAAEQTKVSCSGGTLLVKGPKKRGLFGKPGSIEVTIELPAGSDLQATSPLADFLCEGRLGDCRVKTSLGDIQVDEAAAAHLRTSHGDVRLSRATGEADVVGSGRVEIGTVAGAATVKNGNGDTVVGEVVGELRATSSNGLISVGVAHAGVDAKSANGSIRIDEAVRGQIGLQAATGDVEVGVRESTAAWLDVHTRFGTVHTSLGPAEGPEASEETVEIRARTAFGDIVIRRA
ncbi:MULTISPECIES: DUF4097 family beta strand repeat-containing protein [Streptomyces violaceusniger group]|uniref:DUF4097 family beta strand repeat-containing protein n=2 Tax=Streptomyces rhizosphaericus TaxID=114699 RepID=A0ABN1RBA4_9ACTN|nr:MULTISPECIES: DUF4097 family beta strand repeat-containing protein [Streptomyces violaceusniger group]